MTSRLLSVDMVLSLLCLHNKIFAVLELPNVIVNTCFMISAAFDPHVTPTENLLRLLNFADGINNVKYGTHNVPWWKVEEDDKALYLLRALPTQSEEYPVSDICVTESEESVLHEEYMFAIHPNDEKHREMNMSSLLHAMRQINSEPSEYYFHVMHDFRESPRLAIPASGIVSTFTCITVT